MSTKHNRLAGGEVALVAVDQSIARSSWITDMAGMCLLGGGLVLMMWWTFNHAFGSSVTVNQLLYGRTLLAMGGGFALVSQTKNASKWNRFEKSAGAVVLVAFGFGLTLMGFGLLRV